MREEQFRTLSATLEHRVHERTRKLETANVALQREIAERRRTETQLHGVNRKLAQSLGALETRT